MSRSVRGARISWRNGSTEDYRIAVSAENWDRKDPLRAMMGIAQAPS
jgi:hypothetical protein